MLTQSDLLQIQPEQIKDSNVFSNEQLKDQELKPIILYLKDGTLPTDQDLVPQVVIKAGA